MTEDIFKKKKNTDGDKFMCCTRIEVHDSPTQLFSSYVTIFPLGPRTGDSKHLNFHIIFKFELKTCLIFNDCIKDNQFQFYFAKQLIKVGEVQRNKKKYV